MFQVNFSDQAISELNKLEMPQQMELVETLTRFTLDRLKNSSNDLGHFHRDGKDIYRLRAKDYRIYFEVQGDTIYSHYILPQHSLSDFVYRCKLPVSESMMIEQHDSFWKYLESLKK